MFLFQTCYVFVRQTIVSYLRYTPKNLKLPQFFATSVITTWILKLKCNANNSTGICYLLSEVIIFVDKCAKSSNSANLYGFNKLHRARDTFEVLRRTTSDFVAPWHVATELTRPKSGDLNLVDYVTWSVIQQRVYMRPEFMTSTSCHSVHCILCGAAWSSRWLMMQLTNAQHPLRACVRARGGHFEHTLCL